MKDAPMGKNQATVPIRKSGSNTTPRPDGVKMRASGSKEKPADRSISPKSLMAGGDKEHPVIREVKRKEPPWRKPGSSKHVANSAK